ncbi:Eukaryotic translation initiation factor 4B, partial [Pseudolycoriella hygida]
ATIFGNAKPVDTAAKEREIEERLEKQRALEEERQRERSEKAAAEESSEKEPEVVVDNQVNSWRRRDNERNIDDLPRTQSPPRRRYSPDRRGPRKYDDRRGGRDRDYDNYHRRDNRDRDNRDNRDNRDHRNRDRDQRMDRNRGGDNYNRGSGNNRNDMTRNRDEKDKMSRRDKSAGDPRDIDRMPKYQAPVKPKLQMSNKYEDLDEDGSD